MTSTSVASNTAIPAWKWYVVFLMLLATVINYIDRQALGSMASFIKAEFNLNEQGYGRLEACFGYSYAVFLIVATDALFTFDNRGEPFCPWSDWGVRLGS